MPNLHSKEKIQSVLDAAIQLARGEMGGNVANYIPELAATPPELLSIAVTLLDGTEIASGDELDRKYTVQSTGKLIVLIGALEELGDDHVFSWVRAEPSGHEFSSVARLDQFGPLPSNPMLNAGALALCGHIPGNEEEQFKWLVKWSGKLFGHRLTFSEVVFNSECRTGDKNRSLAYLLKSNGVIEGDVESIARTYFRMCSLEAAIQQESYLSAILANDGLSPSGKRVISKKTARIVLSIMTTCGLYNEAGTHLVKTGMPAKSGVSGFITAVVPRHAGIATMSPRVNDRGTSIRGEIMLQYLSRELDWHFAG